MVVRNKYGGYWHKTRSTVDSGGLSIPCMISMTNIFQPTESPLISPCHAIPDITVPTETGDKLMPTQGRGFSRVPAGMHARHMRVIIITSVSISNSMEINNLHMIISHEITSFSKVRWCYERVIEHTKILCRGSECLPSMCGKAGCTPKLLKVSSLSPKSY